MRVWEGARVCNKDNIFHAFVLSPCFRKQQRETDEPGQTQFISIGRTISKRLLKGGDTHDKATPQSPK